MNERIKFLPLIVVALAVLKPACAAKIPCENPPEIAYLVRHAEKVGPDGAGLTEPVGFDQAKALAKVLEDKGITHIYVTEILRTQQTAEPLAELISVEPVEIRRSKPDVQTEALCSHRPDDRVLIVGHRERLPQIIDELGFFYVEFDYCRLYGVVV